MAAGASFTSSGKDGMEKMDARLNMSGMTEGRSVSMRVVGLGTDPSLALVLSEVEWIRIKNWEGGMLEGKWIRADSQWE